MLWKLVAILTSIRVLWRYVRGVDMSYEEAMERVSRDEAFKATVYAMNTLLIHKGIYTAEEYRERFVEWVEKEERRRAQQGASIHAHAGPHVSA